MVVVGKKGGDDVVRTPVTALSLVASVREPAGRLASVPAPAPDSGPAYVSAQSTHAVGVVYRTSQASFLDREASK